MVKVTVVWEIPYLQLVSGGKVVSWRTVPLTYEVWSNSGLLGSEVKAASDSTMC